MKRESAVEVSPGAMSEEGSGDGKALLATADEGHLAPGAKKIKLDMVRPSPAPFPPAPRIRNVPPRTSARVGDSPLFPRSIHSRTRNKTQSGTCMLLLSVHRSPLPPPARAPRPPLPPRSSPQAQEKPVSGRLRPPRPRTSSSDPAPQSAEEAQLMKDALANSLNQTKRVKYQKPPSAPTFRPTAEEFVDPFVYIEK